MKNTTAAIVKAGAIVGTLDILSACLQFYIKTGKDPLIVLNYITSAIMGKAAFTAGIGATLAGLLLHYIIAFAFTIFFFSIYQKLKLQHANTIITGIVYGIFVWAIMNLVVVPLTRITARPFNLESAMTAAAILIVCIGIPLAFMAKQFYKKA